MKHLRFVLAALVCLSMTFFISCGGDGGGGGNNGPDPAEEQADKLVSTWSISSNGAVLESDIVEGWDSFSITITGDGSGGGYTTTGTGSTDVWPNSGTWMFDGEDIGTVIRDDGVAVAITALSSTRLTLAFNISSGGTRGASVDGNWTFNLE